MGLPCYNIRNIQQNLIIIVYITLNNVKTVLKLH